MEILMLILYQLTVGVKIDRQKQQQETRQL